MTCTLILGMSARHDEKGLVDIRTTALENIALQPCSACFASRGSMIVWIFSISSASILGGDWAGFIETSKELVELILNLESTVDMDEEEYPLKSLRKPFLSLVARGAGSCELNRGGNRMYNPDNPPRSKVRAPCHF